ncbi:hypothetical protein RFI_15362, partial [Reticulomyxa filosa]
EIKEAGVSSSCELGVQSCNHAANDSNKTEMPSSGGHAMERTCIMDVDNANTMVDIVAPRHDDAPCQTNDNNSNGNSNGNNNDNSNSNNMVTLSVDTTSNSCNAMKKITSPKRLTVTAVKRPLSQLWTTDIPNSDVSKQASHDQNKKEMRTKHAPLIDATKETLPTYKSQPLGDPFNAMPLEPVISDTSVFACAIRCPAKEDQSWVAPFNTADNDHKVDMPLEGEVDPVIMSTCTAYNPLPSDLSNKENTKCEEDFVKLAALPSFIDKIETLQQPDLFSDPK